MRHVRMQVNEGNARKMLLVVVIAINIDREIEVCSIPIQLQSRRKVTDLGLDP